MNQPSDGKPTIKQQRAAQREEKLASFRRKQAAEKRNRRIGIAAAITAGVAVLGLVIGFVVVPALVPAPPRDPAATGEVQTWDDLESVHTGSTVDYEGEYDMYPPAGGPHNPAWLNCAIYTEPQKNENAVHSLEHGALWFTYDPAQVEGAELEALAAVVPDEYAILSPFPNLDAPMAVSAWGAQLKFEDPADAAVADFIEQYWRSPDVPEPGASCAGAIDGPGKQA
ncbi:DUF3105 domain-containing protein [Homoserinibacter sp. YIM 151385]|uniref:DUF3105 domain-containing protein n=1 Tax=Homoserinibacter sp. YIM 151385 TaxID=2985506 RepID=UPI0022F0486C|nr:DUF3105 domain-containing protein [Homoserinibacter sp. YIM 151385]WBU36923.1 DUF3105 domain-containing protein [Homoserinibacter sp. YIM 151385]